MSDELPFTVVRSHDHDNDEVLARAVNLLIARHAYREAARTTRSALVIQGAPQEAECAWLDKLAQGDQVACPG
jgi:hypothetical protein